MRLNNALLAAWVLVLALSRPGLMMAEPVPVRFPEGPAQAALVLRSLDGKILADGDLTQTANGGHVTSRVAFRFNDGSMHEETAVFTQKDVLRLLSYRIVQNGPTFRRQLDMNMDTQSGRVIVRHKDRDGDQGVEDETLTIPPDVANGMIPTVLKNLARSVPATISFVAATPGVRQVKLAVSIAGSEPIEGSNRRATHYVVKAEIGGVAGFVAPLVGKQPPDTHVWILEGQFPSFLRSQAALFYGGPIWRIELAKPPSAPTSQ
jgi:hypothetical protein